MHELIGPLIFMAAVIAGILFALKRWPNMRCSLGHSRHHVLTPWGIHHYYGECQKCGRRFDVYD